jgi:hypothetical protein
MFQINDPHQSGASKCLQSCMNQHDIHIKTNSLTTKYNKFINCFWTIASRNDSKARTTYAYWPYHHKLMYNAFKLPNHIPMYNRNTFN